MTVQINRSALWIIIILVVLNVISIGALWLTREKRPVFDDRRPSPEKAHMMARKLGFTPQQLHAFDSLNDRHHQTIMEKTEMIRGLRSALLDHISDGNEDSARLIAKKIGEMHEEVELLNYRHFQHIYSICEGPQKEKFLDRVEQAVGEPHGRMRKRRFHR